MQKAPIVHDVDDASIEMKIPPQSYPIELPVGPPDAVELSFNSPDNAHEENHEWNIRQLYTSLLRIEKKQLYRLHFVRT